MIGYADPVVGVSWPAVSEGARVKLPNWAKIFWWALLTSGLTLVLYLRSHAILGGQATPFDLVTFVVWVALLLLPLFAEISLWGLKLKAQVEEAKKEITDKLASIQNEIRNEVRTTISPTFYPSAPADAQLPRIKEVVTQVVQEALRASGSSAGELPSPEAIEKSISGDVELLLATRYRIERELRRVAASHGLSSGVQGKTLTILLRVLIQNELIDADLADAIRRVYSICSPVVHGEDVTDAQVAFVRDVAPKLLSALANMG